MKTSILSTVMALLLTASLVGCASLRAARLYQQGTLALNAGDSARAISQLREASRLEPNATEIQNHLGLAYSIAGQHESALVAFERAIELDCENAAAAKNLAAARAADEDRKPDGKFRPEGDS